MRIGIAAWDLEEPDSPDPAPEVGAVPADRAGR